MTVTISRPRLSLGDLIGRYQTAQDAQARVQEFWFDGDSATTAFPLPAGWEPRQATVAGLVMRPGTGEDYTVTFDGFAYSVVFAVAPAAVNVGILAERMA